MLKEKLEKYLKKNKQAVGINELAKILKLTEEEKETLSKSLYELEKDNKYLPVAKDFYLKHGVVKKSNKGRMYTDNLIPGIINRSSIYQVNTINGTLYDKKIDKLYHVGDRVAVEIKDKKTVRDQIVFDLVEKEKILVKR